MRIIIGIISSIIAFCIIVTIVYAQQRPLKPIGYVNDFANLLTYEQRLSLNNELSAFEKETTIEIAVITVNHLDGKSIEKYTQEIAKEWGIGKRKKNNGIVFLIAPKERKMRIEVASGIHTTLTNNRTDKIRDTEILPSFQAGKIDRGIINGTHAIMQTLNSSAPSTIQISSSDHIEALGYTLVAFVILLLPIITPLIVRRYALKNKDVLADGFAKTNELAKHPDIKKETCKRFTDLVDEFHLIDRLIAVSKNIKWIRVFEKINSIGYSLNQITYNMKSEIAFTKKAQEEGPGLLKKIPGIIRTTEKKLDKGKPSSRAKEYLEKAKGQYAQLKTQQSITNIDWINLYTALMEIQSNTERAESTHQCVNFDSYSSSGSACSNQSHGFGGSSGFGGGGGFSGGGSSGGW